MDMHTGRQHSSSHLLRAAEGHFDYMGVVQCAVKQDSSVCTACLETPHSACCCSCCASAAAPPLLLPLPAGRVSSRLNSARPSSPPSSWSSCKPKGGVCTRIGARCAEPAGHAMFQTRASLLHVSCRPGPCPSPCAPHLRHLLLCRGPLAGGQDGHTQAFPHVALLQIEREREQGFREGESTWIQLKPLG